MSRTSSTVLVDPDFTIPYGAYVLDGLARSGFDVRFGRTGAPPSSGMAMVHQGRRIWVDADDMAAIDGAAYEWSDVFGKVNVLPHDVESHPRVRLLGPLFGVTIWRLPLGYLRMRHFLRPVSGARAALAGIRFQGITRLPLDAYVARPSDPDHVFHRSRSWEGRHVRANEPRERFIEALASSGVRSDAGLVSDRIPLSDYLARTARSALVFNCPAVHDCLGWKLGEYLALGKAIVSTPIERALPAPLEHGTHVHIVDDDVHAMREAIELLTSDHDYRRHLERGARVWFDAYLEPTRVIARLLGEQPS
jgi:glycosyltransferase involved in cell wall biosynthesis